MNSDPTMQIIVLGMHRSGTSLVANLLTSAGIEMGERLLGSHASNIDGHYEDESLVQVNDGLLRSIGCNWKTPPAYELILQQALNYAPKYREYSLSRGGCGSHWGAKDPRTSLTIPLLFPYLDNPYFIVCRRNADDVAASLSHRDRLPLNEGLRLKLLYDTAIDRFFDEHPHTRRIDIDYDQLQSRPRETIHSLYQFLGTSTTPETLSLATAKVRSPETLRNAKLARIKSDRDTHLMKLRQKPYYALKTSFWRKFNRLNQQIETLKSA